VNHASADVVALTSDGSLRLYDPTFPESPLRALVSLGGTASAPVIVGAGIDARVVGHGRATT